MGKGNTYKIGFFDIDNTMFDWKNHRFVPSGLEAVKAFQREGGLAYVCTARCYANAKEFGVFDLGVKWDGHITSCGGAAFVGHKCIYRDKMKPSEVYKLIEILNGFGGNMEILGVKNRYNIRKADYETLEYHKDFTDHIAPVRKYKGETVVGVLLYTDEKYDSLISSQMPDLAMRRFVKYGCEAGGNVDRNKGDGIAKVLDYLGIKKEEAFAIGDSYPDVSMKQSVGTFIVVGNGEEKAKKFADYVSKPIEEDGIALIFKELGITE